MSAPSLDDAWARHWAARVYPGATLGRYELLARLAAGGMGEVWAARMRGSRGFEKLVALKLLLPHLAGDDEFEERFVQEARIVVQVQHPNVASAIDFGEVDGLLFLVMEWLPGVTLAELLKADRAHSLPTPIAVRLAMQACAGLHAAHEARDPRGTPLGVVHCDVSPQNILVTFDGMVKVLDFGVAVLTALASAGPVPAGKRRYFAPEQASGGPIDRRVDVFAMGLVLHLSVTGQHPGALGDQRGSSFERAIIAQSRACDAPRKIERIVQRALEVDPQRRFQTADELSRALGELPPALRAATDQDVAELVARRCGAVQSDRRRIIDQAIRELERVGPSPIPPSGDRVSLKIAPTRRPALPSVWLEPPSLPAPASRRRGLTILSGLLSLAIIGSVTASGWWFSQQGQPRATAQVRAHEGFEPSTVLSPGTPANVPVAASSPDGNARSSGSARPSPEVSSSAVASVEDWGLTRPGAALVVAESAAPERTSEPAAAPAPSAPNAARAPSPARPRLPTPVRPAWRQDPGF